MRRVRRILVPIAAALLLAAPALAQDGGGAPAPDFTEPCPALYPGDGAGKERIARWMARGAADRGLPRELPVMAALVESNVANIKGDSYNGFFGMLGRARTPERQMQWFTDSASLVRQRRVAEGRPDPAKDETAFGSWIADVERPARQYRSRYQTQLEEARGLIAAKCAPPRHDDVTPPRLEVKISGGQHPLSTAGIVLSVRCPDRDGVVGVVVEAGAGVRRAAAREPSTRGYTVITAPIPRAARRDIRAGRSVNAHVSAIAADAAANTTVRQRLVTLVR
jgi:hypothetical protein